MVVTRQDEPRDPQPHLEIDGNLPVHLVTMNQLVAHNITYWRRQHGWTQSELGKRLREGTSKPWTKASVSAAERSWDGKRVRKFDADELLALAKALEVPLAALFLPPDDSRRKREYAIVEEDETGEATHYITAKTLLSYVIPDVDDEENNAMLAHYAERLDDAIEAHLGPGQYGRLSRFAYGDSEGNFDPEAIDPILDRLKRHEETLREVLQDIEEAQGGLRQRKNQARENYELDLRRVKNMHDNGATVEEIAEEEDLTPQDVQEMLELAAVLFSVLDEKPIRPIEICSHTSPAQQPFQQLLSGELDEKRTAELVEQIRSCPTCRWRYDAVKQHREMVQTARDLHNAGKDEWEIGDQLDLSVTRVRAMLKSPLATWPPIKDPGV
ncbi:helix-turn-helix domain-containing protein [Nonomuraea wenchangensis]|uniref:helix-turn-helix domain-containing protein n=1 Tax=Nonomuraea wenchangensis TaxID=568860 RepID=UPI0033253BCD